MAEDLIQAVRNEEVAERLAGDDADDITVFWAGFAARAKAKTAGSATPRPAAVMIRASPTGPATFSSAAWPERPMASRAW